MIAFPINRHRIWQLAFDAVLIVAAWRLTFFLTFDKATPATLLSAEGARSLAESVKVLQQAGAKLVTAGVKPAGPACKHPNTLLRVSGRGATRSWWR